MLRRLQSAAPDLLVLAGLILVAFGASQLPILGPAFGPMVLGLGLILAVRYGAQRSR